MDESLIAETLKSVYIDPNRSESHVYNPSQKQEDPIQSFMSLFKPEERSILQACVAHNSFAKAALAALQTDILNSQQDRELVFRNLASKSSDLIAAMATFLKAGIYPTRLNFRFLASYLRTILLQK